VLCIALAYGIWERIPATWFLGFVALLINLGLVIPMLNGNLSYVNSPIFFKGFATVGFFLVITYWTYVWYRQKPYFYPESRVIKIENKIFPPQPSLKSDYSSSWERLKKNQWIIGGMFLVYIPAVTIVQSLLMQFFAIKNSSSVVAFLWILGTFYVSLRLSFFRCPRCGKPFFSTWIYHNSLSRKCLHCGLPKYALSDPDASPKSKDIIQLSIL
jgi:hypothetical protein